MKIYLKIWLEELDNFGLEISQSFILDIEIIMDYQQAWEYMAWIDLYTNYYQQKEPDKQFYSILLKFYPNVFQSWWILHKIICLRLNISILIASLESFRIIMSLFILILSLRLGSRFVFNFFIGISIRGRKISFNSRPRTMMFS